jgi:anti-anti-sigma factor
VLGGFTDDVRIDSAEIGPDCFVVCATGGLDGDLTVELGRVLFTLARSHGVRLVADLTGAHSANRTTAGVLTAVAHAVRRENGELVVVSRDPRLEQLVDATGLADLVRLERTLQDAVAQSVVGNAHA